MLKSLISATLSRVRRGRLSSCWDYLRTSLWFVPGIMSIAAVALSWAANWADSRLTNGLDQAMPWFIYVSAPGDAREVLSTILSSMITMASLVFSITMVVLTLAANQFGPRLVRNFMASPQTQIVLGTFVMTIVYCILALASIGRRAGADPVPFVAVSAALALALFSIGLLVLFIHTLARSIVSETVIERVGRELDAILSGLPPIDEDQIVDPAGQLPPDFDEKAGFFGPNVAGYVQAIEFAQLASLAEQKNILVGLYFRAGDYVVEGGRGIAVYPRERLTEEAAEQIRRAVVIGAHRTPVQDPEFPIRHLVEIAVRALSPGINDPYTATAVLAQMSASLCRLMAKTLPSGLVRDKQGKTRIVYPVPTYRTSIGIAFDQIRQNGADKPLIVIHMLEALGRMADHAHLPTQLAVLRDQHRLISKAAEIETKDPADRSDIARVASGVLTVLDRSAAALPDLG